MSALDFDDPTPAEPDTSATRPATEMAELKHRFDEFIAVLAHELRNPLAPICTAVDLLRIKGSPDPDVAAAHDVIERQVQQMTRLMDDLLDVSRITRGKIALHKERSHLAPIVANAVDSSRPLIDQKNQRLTVVLPPEPLPIEADPVRLTQVFLNLLNNAAKFTPARGSIRLEAARQGSDVVISIRDTGIGIPGPMLPHVFELFTQVERSPGRSGSGLGVGLALVKRLVELHGGRVDVRSDGTGRGSEFAVRLPLLAAPPAPARVEHNDAASKPMARPCRVLVVDDIKDLADSLALLLRRMGHDVHIAYNGRAAIEASEMLQPELALLDIGLPEMSGYEIAQRIRKQAWGRSIYLVALTGWGQPEDKTRALELGFNRHMTKPVSFAELEQLVAEAAKYTAAAADQPKLARTSS
jgi:CheY-like chemotaxis protein/two-component sensor histidine kinase